MLNEYSSKLEKSHTRYNRKLSEMHSEYDNRFSDLSEKQSENVTKFMENVQIWQNSMMQSMNEQSGNLQKSKIEYDNQVSEILRIYRDQTSQISKEVVTNFTDLKTDMEDWKNNKVADLIKAVSMNFTQFETNMIHVSNYLIHFILDMDMIKDKIEVIQDILQARECSDKPKRVGVYNILPGDSHMFKVIQKRFNGFTEFYRNWQDYENGFGDLKGEFWLGNKYIALLTSLGNHELRIDLEDWNGEKAYALFTSFKVGDRSTHYTLTISGYSGNAGDSMTYHNNMPFSTYDRDNDSRSGFICASAFDVRGAWWYNSCYRSSLNGKYSNSYNRGGINWVKPESDNTASPSVNCAAADTSFIRNCLGIILVLVRGGDGNSCQTYGLLDDGADKTSCDRRLLKKLNLATRPVTFHMSTVSSSGSTIHGQEVDLQVRPIDSNEDVSLQKVWSVKKLPISTRSAAENVDIRKLAYLADIDIPKIDANDVMLLIGTDSPEAHIPLERQLERMWTTDLNDNESNEKNLMSVEDKQALDIMEWFISYEDGHYKLGLHWRDKNISLTNNIAMTQARLQQLKRKLERDDTLHKMYTTTVNEYIEKGYAKEVSNIDSESKRMWYLLHHPVTNVNKPGKVRVVFDCAAKYQGISLNSKLLQELDLMNSLIGVLIRLKQEQIALAADIEAMFHQVRVQEEDCDALRFLWWPNVEKKIYVDDCLKSVSSEQEAIKLAIDLQSLMKMGGFRLTKWLSNNRDVLKAIPESELAPAVVNLSPGDELPNDKALDVIWDVNEDKIRFKVKLTDKPLTRRGILFIVSSIFDPLGLVSPVTLRAKAIVQNLCRLNDGSELGYGACVYLRLVDGNDKITCTLVIGKARLASIKQMSIPRLELSGAVTACRQILNDELEIKIDNVTFWTDSTIVLGYIRNTSRRFKTFVANRLSIIHNTTSLDQWRHVDSPSNLTDIASRGLDACDSKKLNIWLKGPNFLLEDSRYWPQDLRNELQEVSDNDTELRMEVAIHAMTNNTTDYLMNYVSDWTKLLRATAWLIRFMFYCRQRYLNHQVQFRTGDHTLSELKMATNIDTPVKKDSRIALFNPVLDNELIRTKGRLSTSNLDEYPIILPDNHHVTSLIVRFYHENQSHVGIQQVLAATRMKYWILKGHSLVKKVVGCCIPCERQHSPPCVQQMAPLLDDEQMTADKPPLTFVGIDYFDPFWLG
ncbi:Tenascin-R,Ryncolin-2,Angiopoietin-related protein 1,Angiopoietin-related protein 6,Ficolin-3,Techylectin-5B,Ryncolin-1,Fibrinogen C domain-containing protein 1,Ficolin-2,Fibrinogen-like protein 1,Fibrinogen alpha chain,Tenascin,Ficolin-1,Fibrinogen-like protein A,Microfibril-associated glycoprotein 4,Ryncolin-3,Angiopoietin-related protein 2,Angiopoietin-4 [Mytilus edulis]|uniref:Fibrinogen C-terminal domain-containing protein n=1 Tax=Mytilus edulis TaxID=6550 RepID=A0A8S3SV59_MYTED|nr:Tenascin-R,Ryncolin-2,Angiopoietin-related protein 1,Angiopoietin-related protein 6,Ficolin-3,Techylectin-5B,Ryncolin-1,Fibrinogen C domain-containing protein 1,Ficolin-2,Fibrinogen-like protein 1,Fibrinogen alpha chain,Tenascin,Ficolin-1,Fibrinogen-like protein A,Microfibril-associated glycoprotein 4,Ryncolin-3,Angiopoietin-related protein 2,Angiopoietin-4 [Mytilus edulis]